MNKQEFLRRLETGLAGLGGDELEGCIHFYDEMIDARMEEGLKEENAVASLGSVDDIVAQIISEQPLIKAAKLRVVERKGISVWAIVLIVLGSPVWVSLLAAAVALLAAAVAVYLSVLISLWAVDIALLGGLIYLSAGVWYIVDGAVFAGIAVMGASLVLVGLSVLCLPLMCKASKGSWRLCKEFFVWMYKRLFKKEAF